MSRKLAIPQKGLVQIPKGERFRVMSSTSVPPWNAKPHRVHDRTEIHFTVWTAATFVRNVDVATGTIALDPTLVRSPSPGRDMTGGNWLTRAVGDYRRGRFIRQAQRDVAFLQRQEQCTLRQWRETGAVPTRDYDYGTTLGAEVAYETALVADRLINRTAAHNLSAIGDTTIDALVNVALGAIQLVIQAESTSVERARDTRVFSRDDTALQIHTMRLANALVQHALLIWQLTPGDAQQSTARVRLVQALYACQFVTEASQDVAPNERAFAWMFEKIAEGMVITGAEPSLTMLALVRAQHWHRYALARFDERHDGATNTPRWARSERAELVTHVTRVEQKLTAVLQAVGKDPRAAVRPTDMIPLLL